MAIKDESWEYAKFGESIVRRAVDSTDDWLPVPEEGMVDATIAVRVSEELRKRPAAPMASRIIRSEENEATARRLGLNADQLADRLAQPDQNQGTRERIPEAEFDVEMERLGLPPDEARARFNGSHWTN